MMKLIGLIFLGSITTILLFYPITIVIALLISPVFPDIERSYTLLWIPLLITMPISFLVGSMVTGYFCYYDIEDKWHLLWMAPALYWILIGLLASAVRISLDAFIGVNESENIRFLNNILFPFLGSLYYYLASLAGVGLGYFLRSRYARWRYGD